MYSGAVEMADNAQLRCLVNPVGQRTIVRSGETACARHSGGRSSSLVTAQIISSGCKVCRAMWPVHRPNSTGRRTLAMITAIPPGVTTRGAPQPNPNADSDPDKKYQSKLPCGYWAFPKTIQGATACSGLRRWEKRVVRPLRFSIVIANYNYGRFVARAIDSALGVMWPEVEVIVVDDGSTDNSREIIESYCDRISAIFQENCGQRRANNIGFAQTTGDLIIFLDADDMLVPDIAAAIALVWRDGVSKVQVQMSRVDENERSLESILPRLRKPPSPEEIRQWATTTGEYPSPPGSGNAYARWFLEIIFPLDDSCDSATDSTCIAMAPFLGNVVTILRPMVLYRLHGGNDSNMLANDGNFGREVARAVKRLDAAQRACAMGGLIPPAKSALRRGVHLLQLRAASLRLRPADHPLPGDSRYAALIDAFLLPFRASFEPLSRRLIIAGYSALILTMPLGMARNMIRIRFSYN
jgi:hypothetical protein